MSIDAYAVHIQMQAVRPVRQGEGAVAGKLYDEAASQAVLCQEPFNAAIRQH